MQNAKDTFYIALRNRLEQLNPARVVTIRAVQRPAILVEDAEASQVQIPNNVFVLRWTSESLDTQLPTILAQMTCEIHYSSSGSETLNGLDRGRLLTEMDRELISILSPQQALKMNYSVSPAVDMQTFIFWSEPTFAAIVKERDQLLRTAKVSVFAFEEQGEA